MNSKVLIVPGYRGSGPAHWQTWLQSKLPGSERVRGIDWDRPSLPLWTQQIGKSIDASVKPVWIIAHSFGCLAAVSAIAQQPSKIAGAILVAPADPDRFCVDGVREPSQYAVRESIAQYLPQANLDINGLLVASQNDPWLPLEAARAMAINWRLPLFNAGKAGHINTESGFGPWTFLLSLLYALEFEAETAKSNIVDIKGKGHTQVLPFTPHSRVALQTMAYL